MSTVRSRPVTRQRKPKPSATQIVKLFQQWVTVRKDAETFAGRQTTVRDRLMEILDQVGTRDDQGNSWIDLPEPVEYTDPKGRVFKYTILKRERHLTPSQPMPDPDLAEDLLRAKKLWLTPTQEKTIKDLQAACPFVTISVEVDSDAVAKAYFQDRISETEYEALLPPQKESFQFRPAET